MEGTTYPRMNRVFLTGISQEEPELRYTPSGVTVCSFRVQVGRILRDRSGGAREVAAYLTVVAWQETAQRMARELKKGQALYVEGYVSSRSFTTARGEKRTAVEIYAEQIQILGPFAEGAEGAHAEGEGRGPARHGGRRMPPRPREEPHDEGQPDSHVAEPAESKDTGAHAAEEHPWGHEETHHPSDGDGGIGGEERLPL
jgi:single-strand DNA-binding protein